jgi:hypothetical protein
MNKRKIAAKRARYRTDNPERVKALRRKDNLLYRYNMSGDREAEMLTAQSGMCPCCCQLLLPTDKTAVDHDHACCPGTKSCGECVRGIIHDSCNRMLGHAEDTPDKLRNGALYLERQRYVWTSPFVAELRLPNH